MAVYYNEIDPEKAAWIRELIKAKVVAPGEVDERDIKLVQPEDLKGFRQCHFFAGIAVWSYALRLAGWPDDREVWTGSCPCPSFSSAGKGQGFDDARHLWPDWFRLIRECKPATVFGEQADDAIGYGWLDLVQAQMEAENYAIGKAVLASASVGAADIRERLYFVCERLGNAAISGGRSFNGESRSSAGCKEQVRRSGVSGRMGEPIREGLEGYAGNGDDRHQPGRIGENETRSVAATGEPCGMADPIFSGCNGWPSDERRQAGKRETAARRSESSRMADAKHDGRDRPRRIEAIAHSNEQGLRLSDGDRSQSNHHFTHALKGYWRDADWLFCTDGRWRPVEAQPQPLVDGLAVDMGRVRYQGVSNTEAAEAKKEIGFPLGHNSPARLMRLRGYGDAINSQVAREFICAYMEAVQSLQGDKASS